MAAVDNALWKLRANMNSSANDRGKSPGIKLRKSLVFAIATGLAVAIILVLSVKYGGTYDERKFNSKRKVQSINEGSKRLPNIENSVEKPNIENSVEKRKNPEPWEQARLRSNIHPKHYDMLIKVNLNELTFAGKSSISFQLTSATNTIIFHVNKLKIEKVQVFDSLEVKPFKIRKEFHYTKNQFFVVELVKKLEVGEYKLKLNFDGNIETKELNGFYRSTYKSKNGETRYCNFLKNVFINMVKYTLHINGTR